MSASFRVEVTAEHIAAAALEPDIGEGFQSGHPDSKDPVELAIAAATGQDTSCDEDGPLEAVATIGPGRTTLVVSLPSEVGPWIDTWYRGEAVEPFAFDIEIDSWLLALVARATEARP